MANIGHHTQGRIKKIAICNKICDIKTTNFVPRIQKVTNSEKHLGKFLLS